MSLFAYYLIKMYLFQVFVGTGSEGVLQVGDTILGITFFINVSPFVLSFSLFYFFSLRVRQSEKTITVTY